tara:strand:- start:76 stop:315 length:240 start_codon:yes stop_codon:yes gene_type:complete
MIHNIINLYSMSNSNQLKPIENIEHSLRSMSRQLDTMIIDTQNIKSDLMIIKLYIDECKQRKRKEEKEKDDLNKGWFYF